ncbi:unnamed protein product, partial [Closterium sp. Naga37s-1]
MASDALISSSIPSPPSLFHLLHSLSRSPLPPFVPSMSISTRVSSGSQAHRRKHSPCVSCSSQVYREVANITLMSSFIPSSPTLFHLFPSSPLRSVLVYQHSPCVSCGSQVHRRGGHTRLVSAAAHKFIGEVASDALQFCKIRQAGSGKEMKARGPKEKKLVLTTEDLAAALKEYGVNVRKQDYFVDGPTPDTVLSLSHLFIPALRVKESHNEEDEEDGDAEEVLTVDDAIDSIGFGPYQLFLVCYTGLAWLADAMEMILLSFVGPAARCEFGLSAAEESLIASVVFVGVFLGSYVWGLVADAYGRRRGFTATALFTLFAGLLSAWSPTFLTLLVSRCLVGFGIGGASVVFSLCSEFLPSDCRGFWLVFIEFFWTIGSLLEAALAWAVMPSLHWRALVLLSATPFALLLLLYPFLPESPRFLLLKGNTSAAHIFLEKAARTNGKRLPPGRLVSAASGPKLLASPHPPSPSPAHASSSSPPLSTVQPHSPSSSSTSYYPVCSSATSLSQSRRSDTAPESPRLQTRTSIEDSQAKPTAGSRKLHSITPQTTSPSRPLCSSSSSSSSPSSFSPLSSQPVSENPTYAQERSQHGSHSNDQMPHQQHPDPQPHPHPHPQPRPHHHHQHSQPYAHLPPPPHPSSSSSSSSSLHKLASLLSPSLLRSTLVVWLLFFASAFSYYGLVLLTTQLSTQPTIPHSSQPTTQLSFQPTTPHSSQSVGGAALDAESAAAAAAATATVAEGGAVEAAAAGENASYSAGSSPVPSRGLLTEQSISEESQKSTPVPGSSPVPSRSLLNEQDYPIPTVAIALPPPPPSPHPPPLLGPRTPSHQQSPPSLRRSLALTQQQDTSTPDNSSATHSPTSSSSSSTSPSSLYSPPPSSSSLSPSPIPGCTPENQPEISSQTYSDVFITSAAELPGLLIALTGVEIFGRKTVLWVLLCLAGLFLLPLIQPLPPTATTIFLFAARAAIMGSFAVLWAYTPEIYPTEIRSTGLGVANSWARLGGFLCPFVAVGLIEGSHRELAILLFVFVPVFAALVTACFASETK